MVSKPDISPTRIAEFCRRWHIAELSLFGSVLRDDFSDRSDVDVLVRYETGTFWDMVQFSAMLDEIESIVGRRVDLVEQHTLGNPRRRDSILQSRRVLYAA